MVILIAMTNNSESTTNLGAWIKGVLNDMGKTQVWLAEQVGVEPPQISRIIKGESGATPEILNKIADALHKPRIQAYRAAGHFPNVPEDDQWAEEMLHKLNRVPPRLRPTASRMIEAFVEDNEKEKPATQPRKVAGKT